MPLHREHTALVVGIHHRVGHAGRTDRLAIQRRTEQHVPEREHLAEIAVVQTRPLRVHDHVMQPMEDRVHHHAAAPAAKTETDVRVRVVLHQFADQHEHGELVHFHPGQQPHPGQDQRLQHAVQPAATVIGPAAELALAVVQAVQGPPPWNRVLGTVHPVVDEVVQQVIDPEQQPWVLFEPRHPRAQAMRPPHRLDIAARRGQWRQHQIAEQREQPQQHQQGVGAIHAGQAPVVPALGRPQAFQRTEHPGDQRQLQCGQQQCDGDVAGIIVAPQPLQHRRDHMVGQPRHRRPGMFVHLSAASRPALRPAPTAAAGSPPAAAPATRAGHGPAPRADHPWSTTGA